MVRWSKFSSDFLYFVSLSILKKICKHHFYDKIVFDKFTSQHTFYFPVLIFTPLFLLTFMLVNSVVIVFFPIASGFCHVFYFLFFNLCVFLINIIFIHAAELFEVWADFWGPNTSSSHLWTSYYWLPCICGSLAWLYSLFGQDFEGFIFLFNYLL